MTKWQYWLGWTLGGTAFLLAEYFVVKYAVLAAIRQATLDRILR